MVDDQLQIGRETLILERKSYREQTDSRVISYPDLTVFHTGHRRCGHEIKSGGIGI